MASFYELGEMIGLSKTKAPLPFNIYFFNQQIFSDSLLLQLLLQAWRWLGHALGSSHCSGRNSKETFKIKSSSTCARRKGAAGPVDKGIKSGSEAGLASWSYGQ